MRNLSQAEVLSLRELLQMESNALAQSKAIEALITDSDLKSQVQAGNLAAEGRIKGIQQFITENKITAGTEVH